MKRRKKMYRLKNFVTPEMLKEYGYDCRNTFAIKKTNLIFNGELDNIIIEYDPRYPREIHWDMWEKHNTDITPYIQDLIKEDWIEKNEI